MADVDRTTLTRNLDLMARAGLVRVGAGVDARSKRVTLTREGAARLSEALPLRVNCLTGPSVSWEVLDPSSRDPTGMKGVACPPGNVREVCACIAFLSGSPGVSLRLIRSRVTRHSIIRPILPAFVLPLSIFLHQVPRNEHCRSTIAIWWWKVPRGWK